MPNNIRMLQFEEIFVTYCTKSYQDDNPWWHRWKYHQNDGIYASDYFHYSEITIIIQRFSLWYYSNDTSVPWRNIIFIQQPNKSVNGPCYSLLVWGIHSWRANSSHDGPLMRTYVRSLDDLARNVWSFTSLQKDVQIYCGIEIAINDGIRKNRPHFGWEPRLHPSEWWETSIPVLTLNPNPKCYGQLQAPIFITIST